MILSAVDPIVAGKLYCKCIRGLLRDKVVILATHQLQLIQNSTQVLVLDEGNQMCIGILDDIDPSCVEGFCQKYWETNGFSNMSASRKSSIYSIGSEFNYYERCAPQPMSPILDNVIVFPNMIGDSKDVECDMIAEKVEKGGVSLKTYFIYFWKGANVFGLLLLFLIVFSQFLSEIGVYHYLELWTNLSQNNTAQFNTTSFNFNPLASITTVERSMYFIALCTGTLVLYFVSYTLLYSLLLNASRKLHNTMLWKILRVPMRFFDMNQSGSIINRFSKDIGTLDDIVPLFMIQFISLFLSFFYTLITAIISQWIVIFPTILLYYYYFDTIT